MSQSSSIDRLPSDVREALHGWLRELAITQTEAMERTNALLDELAAQQPVGKRVERGFSESRDRNYDFFRIPTRFKTRNSPQFVGMIRICPCRQSSAPAHCGNRGIGFMDVPRPRGTFPGPRVSPSGEVKGERVTNRESRPLTRCAAQASASSEVFTKHEKLKTKNGF